MRVKDLIEKLEKINDKDKDVFIGVNEECTFEFDVEENKAFVEISNNI